MIYIEKNSTNNVILTLSEKSILTNPNYLFIFENEYNIGSTPITFTTPDVSSYTNRYNQFNIIESATGSTTGGDNIPINLISGQYVYKVYESVEVTLEITETTGNIIEQGRMVVSGCDDDIETTIDSVYQ